MATTKMAVSLSDYTAARTLFQQHYFLANCDTNFGGQEINVSWSDLKNKVDTYIQNASTPNKQITPDDVALRLVLCYAPNSNALFLRMQLCTLVPVTTDHYNLDTAKSVWYEISNGQITVTQNTSLSDSNYLDDFYYCDSSNCSTATLEKLASDTAEKKFVRNVVLPWGMEILQMYTDNQNRNVQSIGFGACSFVDSVENVKYPHTLVLYLVDDQGNKLMDNDSYKNTFEMKGCDMGTMCPVCCNCYNTPQ